MKTQYAKSTVPEVVTAVEHNWLGRDAAKDACVAWALAQGAPNGGFYPTRFGGGFGIGSLDLPEQPKGWSRAKRGYRPRRGSALEKEMLALQFTPEAVLGLPDYFEAPYTGPGHHDIWWMTPVPIFALGAAWVLLGHMPTRGDFGDEWVEVKASEAYAAKEAFEDARKPVSA